MCESIDPLKMAFKQINSVIIPAYENETNYLTFLTLVSSSVGIVLSVIAFALLILTAVIFAEWRKNYKNQLLIQFMVARFLYTNFRYIYDIRNVFYLCNDNSLIYLDTLGLIFTEYALICWMFIFSKQMNDCLVKVFNVPQTSIWKTSLYTWTISGIISVLLYIAYILQNGKDLIYFLLYMFLLKWPVLCANAVLLIQALIAVLNSNQSRSEYNIRIIIMMIVLIFVFSFQQILVDTYKIIHLIIHDEQGVYFMTIVNIVAIYQNAFAIIFWVFGNAKTRQLWRFRKPKLTPQSSIKSNSV